ncbi:helix-hairpin-helix domain-containing protein [Actinomycetes bacterium M1A6_2h]
MAAPEIRSVRRRLDTREPENTYDYDDDIDETDGAEPVGRVRIDPGRRGMVTLVGVGLAAVVVAALFVWRDRPVPQPVSALPVVVTTSVAAEPAIAADLVVSVVGAIARPGLVTVPPGSRVADVLRAGGGALPGTDLLGLNLAQKVSDGDQIVVGAPAPPVSSAGTPDNGASRVVSLNSATESELDALPGVGPVTAASIVAWREANGPFTSVDQLSEVDGIGPTRLEKLRDLVSP